jgi:hypothetical protein
MNQVKPIGHANVQVSLFVGLSFVVDLKGTGYLACFNLIDPHIFPPKDSGVRIIGEQGMESTIYERPRIVYIHARYSTY